MGEIRGTGRIWTKEEMITFWQVSVNWGLGLAQTLLAGDNTRRAVAFLTLKKWGTILGPT